MRLLDLELINFRNYEYEKVAFDSGLNFIYGKNAQGKTNLLESIYLSSNASSFKSINDREMIRFNERSAYVKSNILIGSRKKEIECKLSMSEKKRIRINGLEIDRIKDLREQFAVVLFAPDHIELVRGGPAVRRDFMDELLKNTNRLYLQAMNLYKKILFQRNQLLKKKPRWLNDQLDALDKQLAPSASYIVKNRRMILDELMKILKDTHKKLSGGLENIDLKYKSNGSEDISENYELLKAARENDLRLQTTSIGPHRDDLEFFINDKAARNFASQGQCRTVTLSCKLAQAELRKKINGLRPILLLDDVFSELDRQRCDLLFEEISQYQSLVTGNSAQYFNKKNRGSRAFKVEKGKINLIE